jgi:hypothetical protein
MYLLPPTLISGAKLGVDDVVVFMEIITPSRFYLPVLVY